MIAYVAGVILIISTVILLFKIFSLRSFVLAFVSLLCIAIIITMARYNNTLGGAIISVVSMLIALLCWRFIMNKD